MYRFHGAQPAFCGADNAVRVVMSGQPPVDDADEAREPSALRKSRELERWDWFSQAKRAEIVMPNLTKRVERVYPAEAIANHISARIRVYFVIGADSDCCPDRGGV